MLRLWVGLLACLFCFACGNQNSLTGGGSSTGQKVSEKGEASTTGGLNAHPRDPDKPGDNEESIPGYLTDPNLVSAQYDEGDETISIVAQEGFVQSDDEEPVSVAIWYVDHEKSEQNAGLWSFFSSLGAKILQTFLPTIFKEPEVKTLAAELIETINVVPGEGFSANFGMNAKDIVVVSVAPVVDETMLSVVKNDEEHKHQFLYSPSLDRGFVAFDGEDLRKR